MGARRNWKLVLNKQRFEATLQQHRDATNGKQPRWRINTCPSMIHRITDMLMTVRWHPTRPYISPCSPVLYLCLQIHNLHCTWIRRKKWKVGHISPSPRSQAQFQWRTHPPITPSLWRQPFIRTPDPGRGNGKQYKPAAAAVRGIVKRLRVTI